MACLCVVFSGAVKKVLQLHADKKINLYIHPDINGTRSSQSINDVHREKHEIQAIVLSEHKQFPTPGFKPPFNFSLFQVSPALLNVYQWTSSMVSYKSHEATASCVVPEFLFLNRLQV